MTSKYKLFLVIYATIAFCNAFKLGTERTFSIVNDVSQYDLKTADQPISYRISGAVKVGTIWGNNDNGFLLRFELESPQLYLQKRKVEPVDYDEKSSVLKSHHKTTFYALWRDGLIEQVFLPQTKDASIDNFLKSIVSLFQYQLIDGETTQEEDISGRCKARYTAKSSTKYMKYKTECSSDLEFRERLDKPLGVDNRMTRVNVITVSADGHLESIHSTDHHKFSVNAYPNVGFVVSSLFYLQFDGQEREIKVKSDAKLAEVVKTLGDVTETNLLPVDDVKNSDKNLIKLVKEAKENLQGEKVGKALSAQTILQLLTTARSTKTEDFTRILAARTTKEIRGQLIDLLAAAQTEPAHEAFRKSLNFTEEEDFGDIERYLQGLSVGIQPLESVIRDLLSILTSENEIKETLRDSLVQTVASMANRFANSPYQDFESHVVVEVKNFLMKSINKCTTNDCKVVYIQGLQNLASPDTIDKLLSLAINFPYQISVAAMKALSKFPVSHFSSEIMEKFEDIFYQRLKRFDSSARASALDILLKFNLDTGDVVKFISYLKSEDRAYEIKQYLIQRLKMAAEKCPQFNEMLKMALASDPQVNNWNVYGGMKGLSTTLERQFSRQPSFNGSILSIQEMKGGILKRGTVDLLVHSGDEETSLFSLGLFAGGLSSFIKGSENEEVDPDEDTTTMAGMELAIQGAQMRPLTFFKGQGELMGHVWSGTASEPTTAYKGVTLLQDHKQIVSLNNGALLDLTVLGAISVDLNGKIEISLWYKNAKSEIVQNTGSALLSSALIRSSIVQLSIESELLQEPQLNLSSKTDFSGDTAICMQLSQPNTELNQSITKSIHVPSEKKPNAYTRQIKLRYSLPGHTHVLNRKNTEMCNKILK